MKATMVFEWTFSPPDYFADEVEQLLGQDYTMTIKDGQARAQINSVIYETSPEMRQRLHETLDAKFRAAQLFSHRSYELSRSTMTRKHPDGHEHYFLEAEPINITVTMGAPDIQIIDKNGKIIADSKRDRIELEKSLARDRIEKQKSLAALIDAHQRDDTLASMLRGLQRAVKHPDHELVHLYEVRDALSERFHRDVNAIKTAVGITDVQWDRFRELCCNEPLKSGAARWQG